LIKHIDLFSGIGGFSEACDWLDIETILFCENDEYCTHYLKNRWPGVSVVKDVNNAKEIKEIVIAYSQSMLGNGSNHNQRISKRSEEVSEPGDSGRESITPDSDRDRPQEQGTEQQTSGDRQLLQDSPAATNAKDTDRGRTTGEINPWGRTLEVGRRDRKPSLILTAGFPCQPFSNAGRKQGANDDRYLWPQTLAVIETIKPDWVILENVAGLLGMVFPDSGVEVDRQESLFPTDTLGEADLGSGNRRRRYDTIIGTIMDDMRNAGYETTLLVLPACSLSAPHRRDRVWIVAHAIGTGTGGGAREACNEGRETSQDRGEGIRQGLRSAGSSGIAPTTGDDPDAPDTGNEGLQGGEWTGTHEEGQTSRRPTPECHIIPSWQENWDEVATRLCRVDDGLPDWFTKTERRTIERAVKAFGRAEVEKQTGLDCSEVNPWRTDQLKALGNSIVPQIAYILIQAIADIERQISFGDI